MAEPRTVIPIDSGLLSDECHGVRVVGIHEEVDVMQRHAEPVTEVFNVVRVGQNDLDRFASFDLEVVHTKVWRSTGHVDSD